MMADGDTNKRLPLEGVKVLSVEQFITGPYCTQLLADAGAEVIKIERPGVGDPRRTIGPYIETSEGQKVSGGFIQYNRNKKSLTLNLAAEEGKEVFRQLAGQMDVVVENLRPGSMKKMGLDYEALSPLNPRLIYAAISGFGQHGPYQQWPALDIVVEAMSGIMDIVGFEDRPPTYTIYGMADLYAGQVNAYSIMLALFAREMTGEGQMVDTSMYDSMIALNERSVAIHSMTGQIPMRGRERVLGPRGAYEARDGYVALNIPTDEMWGRLTEVLGREDLKNDPRCSSGPERAENSEFIRSVSEEWMSSLTQEEAVQRLLKAGVPAGPVRKVNELFDCPQVKARDMLLEVPHQQVGPVQLASSPASLSDAPKVTPEAPPELGEHNRQILTDMLGMPPEKIDILEENGVI